MFRFVEAFFFVFKVLTLLLLNCILFNTFIFNLLIFLFLAKRRPSVFPRGAFCLHHFLADRHP